MNVCPLALLWLHPNDESTVAGARTRRRWMTRTAAREGRARPILVEDDVRERVTLLEDARWNGERECVEVTALIHETGGSWKVRCAITREALEARARMRVPVDPVRLARDFASEIEGAISRKIAGFPPEVAITTRDLQR